MLVWNILLTLALAIETVVIWTMYDYLSDDLYTWIGKFEKLISYNPYNWGFRKKEKNPYDSTPEFIEGIKAMAEELERPMNHRIVRYNQDIDSIQEQNRRIDNLEKYCYGTKEKDDAAD